jgi:hypothetical protein
VVTIKSAAAKSEEEEIHGSQGENTLKGLLAWTAPRTDDTAVCLGKLEMTNVEITSSQQLHGLS